MSITPTDFLESAKAAVARDPSETARRNAVSRAYYAAFHQANLVFPPDKEFAKNSNLGMHETYIDQLMQGDPGTIERNVAVKLKTLKGRRTTADYKLDDEVRQIDVAMQIQGTELVFGLLSNEQVQTATVGVVDNASSKLETCCGRPKLQRIT